LCAVFLNVPVAIAMTATEYKLDRKQIKESLGLHNCFELVPILTKIKEYLLRKGI
jgi:hypothetical protein